VAQKIRWPFIIWLAGLVNVVAMLPQLYKILKTHDVQGISLGMFSIYFGIQVAFSLEGYFKRNTMFFVCMTLSYIVTGSIIGSVLYFR
jgi:uncharacterized protein with PQ loop repeat